MEINVKDNFFDYVKEHPQYKVVVYGAGKMARSNYQYFGHIDFFCDRKAEEIGCIENVVCITPEELLSFKDKVIVLISIQNQDVVRNVCKMLKEIEGGAEVFYFFDNPAFSRFDISKYQHAVRLKERLKIRIIYRNDGWILEKFARKLQEELTKLGQMVDIAETEDVNADVNHYIPYYRLNQFWGNTHTVTTSMITHIDCTVKRDLIEYQTNHGAYGVCMSEDTMNMLARWGIPRTKLCYVNPAHDREIIPKKIVLGITNKCYSILGDLKKRDDLILLVCRELDPQYFMLKIMGTGWDDIVGELRKAGYEVEYYPEFNKEIYNELMPSLDYWIYYGFDEGGMGFLDALAAGVKTIVTPQGYHLDVKGEMIYFCRTISDFINVLKNIQNEKKKIVDSVKEWTWENYARKHLEIWRYLTGTKPLRELYQHQSEYFDGIFSLMLSDICVDVKLF